MHASLRDKHVIVRGHELGRFSWTRIRTSIWKIARQASSPSTCPSSESKQMKLTVLARTWPRHVLVAQLRGRCTFMF